MFLYGYHPVREALRHRPHEVARVLVAAGRGGRRREEIEELAARHQVELRALPERELAKVAGAAHHGFAAEVRERSAVSAASAASAGAAGGAAASPARVERR